MTRARKNGKGEETFGHVSRALVYRGRFYNRWYGFRVGEEGQQTGFRTWAEALAYALGEDKNDEA